MTRQNQRKKNLGKSLKMLGLLLLVGAISVGCASKKANVAKQNENTIQELNQRIATMEGNVLALNTQLRASQGQVYEVRNRSGKKTGMTAHPMGATQTMPTQPIATVTPYKPQPKTQTPTSPKTHKPIPRPVVQPKTANVTPVNSSAPANMSPTIQGNVQNTRPAVTTPSPNDGFSLPPEAVMYLPNSGVNAPNQNLANSPRAGTPSMPPANTPALPNTPAMPPADIPNSNANTLSNTAPVNITQTTANLPSQPPQPGEQAAYKQALDLVRGGQSQAGREKFQTFLQNHPQSKLAANAYYWMGESHYAQGNYNDALLAFRQVSANFPRHDKASDALLKAGMSYQRLGDSANAQAQYQTLINNFPRSSAAKIARNRNR